MSNERKIIQIATSAADNGHSLYALCDDGTVWDYQWIGVNVNDDRKHWWKQVAPITRCEPFVAPVVSEGGANG